MSTELRGLQFSREATEMWGSLREAGKARSLVVVTQEDGSMRKIDAAAAAVAQTSDCAPTCPDNPADGEAEAAKAVTVAAFNNLIQVAAAGSEDTAGERLFKAMDDLADEQFELLVEHVLAQPWFAAFKAYLILKYSLGEPETDEWTWGEPDGDVFEDLVDLFKWCAFHRQSQGSQVQGGPGETDVPPEQVEDPAVKPAQARPARLACPLFVCAFVHAGASARPNQG